MSNDDQILATLQKILANQEQTLAIQNQALEGQQKAISSQQIALRNQIATGRIYRVALFIAAVVFTLMLYAVFRPWH